MSENKKIAKNSIILYGRLIITTIIGLYSSRIVLLELGAGDYGLYAVLGGIVAMMNMMSSSMIATSNRYLAVEVGKGSNGDPNKVFNTLLILHIIFSLFFFIIAEIGGTWYVENYLNVDPLKVNDAQFVLHLSVFASVLSTVIMPFKGLVTIHERFKFQAGMEVTQSILNLVAVLLLVYCTSNKLRIYALYILLIQIIINVLYFLYCYNKFSETIKFNINPNPTDYKDVSKFFGWQMVYVVGSVGAGQGGTLIINFFFGTVLNAAFGLAEKIYGFVYSFVRNLNQAATPQIVKNYSSGNQDRSLMLIYKLSKFTFFIMLIPAVPILLSLNSFLTLWLTQVPVYTAYFVALKIILGLVRSLESGFDATIDATGRIRKTKVVSCVLMLSMLPIAFILYKYGFPPYAIALLYIVAELFFLVFQTRILAKLTDFTFASYFAETILPVSLVTLLILPQYFLSFLLGKEILNILIISLLSVMLTSTAIYLLGLNKEERLIMRTYFAKLKGKK